MRKNSIVKRIIALSGAVVMLLSIGLTTVKADVLYEPADSFLEKHMGEYNNISREIYANGPDGKLDIYESPESEKVVGTLQNGDVIGAYISFTDKSGVEWLCVENFETELEGWCPAKYTIYVYDGISFEEEHKDEIVHYGTEPVLEMKDDSEFVLWQYPGSKDCQKMTVEDEGLNGYSYDTSYTDESGRTWIQVNYWYGIKDYWLCVDEPSATYEELVAAGTIEENAHDYQSELDKVSTEETQDIIKPDSSDAKDAVKFVVIGVVAVVVITGLILVYMKRK